MFGLEELFENRLPVPQNGRVRLQGDRPLQRQRRRLPARDRDAACSQAQQADPNNTTTHPDQHGGIFIPDGQGGVTLVAGNDGGNYTQHVGSGGDFTRQGFGKGAQDGFHTLLPYGAARPEDGVVYAGLQDNGEMRISPAGRQVEVFGGDGVFTVVDPDNSNIAYEELPEAGTNLDHRRRQDMDRHRSAASTTPRSTRHS